MEEFKIVAMLTYGLRFHMHLMAVRAIQLTQMRIMWIDPISKLCLFNNLIQIRVTFRTHTIAEIPLGRRIVEIIRYIPDGFVDLVLYAVLMTVNALNSGFMMLSGQQLSVIISIYIWFHDVTGRTGQRRVFFCLKHAYISNHEQKYKYGNRSKGPLLHKFTYGFQLFFHVQCIHSPLLTSTAVPAFRTDNIPIPAISSSMSVPGNSLKSF